MHHAWAVFMSWWKVEGPARGLHLMQICSLLLLFCFGTIRTSAMRVIHITVKTEVTQKLRIMFVLCCST